MVSPPKTGSLLVEITPVHFVPLWGGNGELDDEILIQRAIVKRSVLHLCLVCQSLDGFLNIVEPSHHMCRVLRLYVEITPLLSGVQ